MTETVTYCKAYEVKDLRRYPKWKEDVSNLQTETDDDGKEIARSELADDDVLFLHANYVVTDGIVKDEHIVFDDVTDEWKAFCSSELAFEIPEYETIEIITAEEPSADEAAAGADG